LVQDRDSRRGEERDWTGARAGRRNGDVELDLSISSNLQVQEEEEDEQIKSLGYQA